MYPWWYSSLVAPDLLHQSNLYFFYRKKRPKAVTKSERNFSVTGLERNKRKWLQVVLIFSSSHSVSMLTSLNFQHNLRLSENCSSVN